MDSRRRLRADARANRERIVAAAREVFAEQGGHAPFDAIAQRAGVGNATLYRHFQNAEALHAAILDQRLEEAIARLRSLDEESDAWAAVAGFVDWVAAAPDVSLVDLILGGETEADPLTERLSAVRALLAGLVERAIAQQLVRADLTELDIDLIMLAVTQVGLRPGVTPEARRRFTEIVLTGIRPR